MMFTWIIITVLIVAGAWYISKNKQAPFTGDETEEAPLEILKKRYARGEISEEEYREQKEILESDL